MSEKYEKGKTYVFAFSRISNWNGARYIVLKDPETGSETMPEYEDEKWVFRVPAKPFQCEWDNGCEWSEFHCRVTGFLRDYGGETTFPILSQDRTFVNGRLYGEADVDKPLSFEVVKVQEAEGGECTVTLRDPLTDIWYDFMATDFPDEELITGHFVKVFPYKKKNGGVGFVPSSKHGTGKTFQNQQKVMPIGENVHSSISVDSLNVLNLPSDGESKYVEYKSSLVYPAGETEPDVDKQLGHVIVRVVASFMNSDGGCVYVGIRDNGEVCGIENEVAFLNKNSEDTTPYKPTIDGIQLKILNTIREKLGDAAGSLVDVRFKQGHNSSHLVCEIIVRANETEIPVYANGTNLYVRYSGQTQRLEGEQAARYIIDRLRRLDSKRSEQDAIDPAAAVAAAVQIISKSLVDVPAGGTGKKPATIIGRPVVVADNTSVPLERLHVKALTNIGGLVFDGMFVGEAKNWGDLYVQLLRQLSVVDPEKFEQLPDETQFRGRGGRPAFARKGSRIHLRDASPYLGCRKDVTADRRDGTRNGFYEPNGYPIRLIKHFGLEPEQFRIWTGK